MFLPHRAARKSSPFQTFTHSCVGGYRPKNVGADVGVYKVAKQKTGKRRMPHYEKQLKAAFVRSAPTGRHTDGGGLYLYVSETGARRWVLRTTVRGKRRDFGLGSAMVVSLADAREIAHEYRVIAAKGGDPSRKIHQSRKRTMSFEAAATEYHKSNIKTSSRRGKHTDQWFTTLRKYAFPVIGDMSVDEIVVQDVLRILQPIWLEKHETARRVFQRMKVVFDWANVQGFRSAGNPVVAVKAALPRKKVKVKNFAAIPWDETPALMRELEMVQGIGALALRFTILTVLRSGAVRKATWNQFSTGFQTWTIPAENMKANEQFEVPLPLAATEILQELWDGRNEPTSLVFPSPSNPDKMLSENTMSKILKKFHPEATVHGMRSAYRDWAEIFAEASHQVKEAVLAHSNPNKVENAYLRTKYFDERESLMEVWGMWATGQDGTFDELVNRYRLDRLTVIASD
ncbi:MAG: integrase arm-type DNA-binding domain-containing protein [Roseobacter sp.]